MLKAKLTSKGQVTVPKQVREQMGLREGDRLRFIKDDGGFRIEKAVPVERFRKWRGYFQDLAGEDPDELLDKWRGS